MTDPTTIKAQVREHYQRIAETAGSCCGGGKTTTSCCDSNAATHARAVGYDERALADVPEGANLGLGCGNPVELAALRPGEVVLDLGAGAGFDALLAAKAVGPGGRVIGVDMTPAMLERARTNAVRAGLAGYVEFREGSLESLPVIDGSIDVVISNCVINLVPDKAAAFREIARVLRPGGRLAISDILVTRPLPEMLRESVAAYVSCIGGAPLASDYLALIEAAGLVDVATTRQSMAGLVDEALLSSLPEPVRALGNQALQDIAATVWSYKISARRP